MKLEAIKEILSELDYETELVQDASFDDIGESNTDKDDRNLRYLSDIRFFDGKLSKSAALIIDRDINLTAIKERYEGGIITCRSSKECFYAVNIYLHENTDFFGRAFATEIDSSAIIGKNVSISEFNVKISGGSIIEDNVTICPGVVIGENVRICSGAILGSEGVMLCDIKGKRRLIPHSGRLYIGSKAIIMNSSIIQKGINTAANTIIGDDAIIGSGVQVSHGTTIGNHTIILDSSNIAGYCRIGRNTWIGAGCVLRNGLTIGDNAHVALGTVLIEDVGENCKISGFFGIERSKSLRIYEKLSSCKCSNKTVRR